jgi:hypothetical protein
MIAVKVVRYWLLISFYMVTGKTKRFIAPNPAFDARWVDFYTLISVILRDQHFLSGTAPGNP